MLWEASLSRWVVEVGNLVNRTTMVLEAPEACRQWQWKRNPSRDSSEKQGRMDGN